MNIKKIHYRPVMNWTLLFRHFPLSFFRTRVHVNDVIGEGQFGDVHRGTFETDVGDLLQVAVKTEKYSSMNKWVHSRIDFDFRCYYLSAKLNPITQGYDSRFPSHFLSYFDFSDSVDKFLEEAYIMQQFDHPHIIKLLGVCMESPIWIVMELAQLGEVSLAKTESQF